MSTMLLIGRTPAALQPRLHPVGRRADRDVGDRAGVARAQLGVLDDDVDVALVDGLQRRQTSRVRSTAAGPPRRGTADAGRPYAVATSRAMPTTDMQSGRLAVTSKSMTASPSAEPLDAFDREAAHRHRRARSPPACRARRRTRAARRARTFIRRMRELLEEAQVVLVEQADVVDAVLQHRDALDAHAEREAGDLLRVVADRFEDRRMHHAAAEDLEPAGLLADAAARAAAARGS